MHTKHISLATHTSTCASFYFLACKFTAFRIYIWYVWYFDVDHSLRYARFMGYIVSDFHSFFFCLIFYAFTILFIDVFFFHCSWCLIRRIRTHSVSATIHKDTSGKAKRYIIIFRHGNGKMTARSTLRCCQLKIKIIFSLPFFPSHLTSRSRFFPRPMFISSNLFPFHLESFTCYMLRKWNSICHEQHLTIGMGYQSHRFFSCSESINLKYNSSTLIYGKREGSGHKKYSFLRTKM